MRLMYKRIARDVIEKKRTERLKVMYLIPMDFDAEQLECSPNEYTTITTLYSQFSTRAVHCICNTYTYVTMYVYVTFYVICTVQVYCTTVHMLYSRCTVCWKVVIIYYELQLCDSINRSFS